MNIELTTLYEKLNQLKDYIDELAFSEDIEFIDIQKSENDQFMTTTIVIDGMTKTIRTF